MIRTVKELIEDLEQYDDDTPVYLGEQPNYPFRYSLKGTTLTNLNGDSGDDEDDEEEDDEDEDEESSETTTTVKASKPPRVKTKAVILLEGSQIAYGKRDWWESSW